MNEVIELSNSDIEALMSIFDNLITNELKLSKLKKIDLDSAFAIVRSMSKDTVIKKIKYGKREVNNIGKLKALAFLTALSVDIYRWEHNNPDEFKNAKRRRWIDFVI